MCQVVLAIVKCWPSAERCGELLEVLRTKVSIA